MIGPPQPPPRRRPVSQQRYAVRRLMVITVLVLIGFGAYRGIAELTDENEASGQEPVDSSAASSTPAEVATTIATTTQAPTTPPPTTTTTEPDRSGPPTEDSPADVLIVGDSDAGTFAPFLEPMLDEYGVVDVQLDYVVSSGLARPDFHDWQRHLGETMASSDPDIVIVTFGGNDAQGLTATDGDVVVGMPTVDNAAEWQAEYVGRVNEAMATILADGDATVIWVGIPNARDVEFTELLRIQDQAVRQALQAYPDVIFVDTWELFDGRNGGIAEMVVDPRDGVARRVRAEDGFHLNPDGAGILAATIAAEVEEVLADLGADV